MSGVVYTLDENDFIISEQKMDFSYAVARYMNKRDQRGRRYYVAVEGKEVPYKRKPKKLVDITGRHKSERSEAIDQNLIDEQP